jgi:hypothetical protein
VTTKRTLSLLACALVVPVFSTAAYANILYESYNSTAVGVTFPVVLTAFTDIAGQNIFGAEFSPTESGTLQSLTASIAVENLTPPGGSATYQFNLFAQPVPGAIIDPFKATPIDTFSQVVLTPGNTITSITFASTDKPVLSTADTYWLYMGTSPGEEQPLDWGVPSSTGLTGTINDASNGPPFFTTTNQTTTGTLPAFILNGTVPEPDSKLLAGIAFALLIAFRLAARRSRYRFVAN